MAEIERPLSPHLQIWSWGLHMAASIVHRSTGVANTAAALLLVWGLAALAGGAAYFAFFLDMMTSPLGRFVLFGITMTLMLHMCTGVRHLLMDTGRILEPSVNKRAAAIALAAGVTLTLGLWIAGYHFAGAY